MDRTSRPATVALLLIFVLILAPLTSTSSGEVAPNGLELIVEINEPQNDLYHTNDVPLDVTIKIQNHAEVTRELQYNPACAFDLIITNGDWSFDIDDERICPSITRAFAIQPGQTRVLDTWEWDWIDAPGGTLTFNFRQADTGLSAEKNIDYYPSIEMPENLEMKALLAQTIDTDFGHTDDMPAMTKISLVNVGLLEIEIPFDSHCRVQMTVENVVDTLTKLGCGHGIIMPGEEIALGWVEWDFDNAIEGEYTIEFAMTAVQGASSAVEVMFTHTPGILNQEALVPSLSTEVGDFLEWRYALENQDDNPVKMQFSNSCVTQMHVLSPTGEIVYDTRKEINCAPTGGMEFTIPGLDTYIISTGTWNLRDSAGCELDDGLHLLVVTQSDSALVATHAFTYTGEDTGPACRAESQDRSDIQFTVDNLQILDAGSLTEHMSFNLNLANHGQEEFNLYWPTDFTLDLTFSQNTDEMQNVYQTWRTDCSSIAGQSIALQAGEVYEWSGLIIPFVIDGVPLENGTWLITAQTTSIPSFITQAAHTYTGLNIVDSPTPVPMPAIVVEENQIVEENNSSFFDISGNWYYVTQPKQGCWLLTESSGNEWSFVSNMEDARWMPQPGMSGNYAVEQVVGTGDCATWPSIVILSTISEDVPTIIAKPSETVVTDSTESPAEIVIENAPAAAAVVATTSLSIMILLYVGNTEWIRISALQVGIGLIGMVRKTREHDGEYQRGRIMGYLTANPGVHFRALLGALDMSNGQLTHHLKNLQGEDRIWRRKDGRLVRFYPASIQQSTNEDDLPVPLLTPDPNSLQGKILRLLDATENDIVNLSQKELAQRLKASQQLVSHHLRTLQKFGLIEREKVGMRYRYQLTREAIFLVNSSEYSVDLE